MKKNIRFLEIIMSVVLLTCLTGCQIVDASSLFKIDKKKEVVAASIKNNKTFILEALNSQDSEGALDLGATYSSMEEVEAILNHPESIVSAILREEKGEAIIDFIYSVSVCEDSREILEKASPLLTDDQYLALRMELSRANESARQDMELDGEGPAMDKVAHAFAGAASALATAAVVYAATPSLSWSEKIGTAAALGTASGIVAGGLKELYDYYSYGGSADWEEDWAATSGGAALGAALCAGFGAVYFALGCNPVGAVVIVAVFSVACGVAALKSVGII